MPNLPKNSNHSLFNIPIYSFFPCASHYPLKQLAADWSFSQCIWNGNYAYAALFQRKTGSQPGMKSKCQRHLLPLIYLINSSEPVAQFIKRLKTPNLLSFVLPCCFCHFYNRLEDSMASTWPKDLEVLEFWQSPLV